MSSLGFQHIPSDILTPLFFAELSNANANTAGVTQRALVIGQITSTGVAPPSVPLLCQGPDDAVAQGGPGSMLALMSAAYLGADPTGELYYLPLADDGSATAASGAFAFTHAATSPGVLSLYIGAQLVSLPVTASQTDAQLATALAAAINANLNLPVIAAVDGVTTTKVDITAKNGGLAGNDIDIRVNYRGGPGGEQTPAALAFTITPMTGGLVNPSLTAGLAALGDMPFDMIVLPYTDTTSLDAMKAFLDDNTGRWSWANQIYGHAIYSLRGTSSALVTAGTARNDQHASDMGFNDSPTPCWVWAAGLAGAAFASLKVDPALPQQTLPIPGVLAPPQQSRFSLSQRNTLLHDGISTFTVDTDGTVRIENLITTYQKNAAGSPDNSYLQIETLFTLMFVLRFLKTRVTSKYGRKKLAADGTRLAPGSNVVTPSMIKAELIAAYRELELNFGLVQDSVTFAANLIVELNASNPSRVDVLWPGKLIGGLRIFALLAQFRLI